MKPQSPTVDNLYSGLRRLHPRVRKTRLVNWALVIWGVLRARSAMIPDIAAQLPLPIQSGSREKRVTRWLDNPAVQLLSFFAPVARCVLRTLVAADVPVRLLVDRVGVADRVNLLIVCVAYRRRAFPLLWQALDHAGASTAQEQIALLKALKKWLPKGVTVYVIADREFRRMALAHWLAKQRWHYVLRLQCDTRVEVAPGIWTRLDAMGLRPGQQRWLTGVAVARKNPFGPTHVALYWERGYEEPWFLMTDLPTLAATVKMFRVRMWCEQLWRDFKRQGFDLGASGLVTGARLERLLLAVALATVWALWTGAELVRRHQRRRIDSRRERRLSYFLIGLRWLEHCMALHQPLTLLLPPQPLEVTI